MANRMVCPRQGSQLLSCKNVSPVISNALIVDIYVKYHPRQNPCSVCPSLSLTSKLDRVSFLSDLGIQTSGFSCQTIDFMFYFIFFRTYLFENERESRSRRARGRGKENPKLTPH